ncbi:hypothetical protein RBE51_18735 [Pseudomonas taiwanensis]|uniref:hypothetical protein n=1 Tax=Pseudomonas taiwanensis TaxID=470150 RepID=UPI0028DF3FBA|nr:hypothetical protein [Pseudomonas taiwanensis]MDT8924831.1 hypothetical protein [Pseudomonas taiwanensis]
MSVRYAQHYTKMTEYLEKNGYLGRYGHLRSDLIQADFDTIFSDFFSKKNYQAILQDFARNGCGQDTLSRFVVQLILASSQGRDALLRLAMLTGSGSIISNELLKGIDTSQQTGDTSINAELFLELEMRRWTPAHEMYFPQWPDAAGVALGLRIRAGHAVRDMVAMMNLCEFFAALPHLNEAGLEISQQAQEKLTFPNAYLQLPQADLATVFAYQAKLFGQNEAVRRWLPNIQQLDLSFIGLQTLANYLDVEEPGKFVNEMLVVGDDACKSVAELVCRLTVNELGLQALNRLSKSSLDYLVKERALTHEQALLHPSGGERYAAAALEEGLGL